MGTMCPGLQSGPMRTVTRVLDGETMVLDDGTELRLIGALAPRAIDADAEPGTWPAETAAAEALRVLVLGKSVELGFAGERADRYGRLQAHAFLVAGEERRWVQGELIEQRLRPRLCAGRQPRLQQRAAGRRADCPRGTPWPVGGSSLSGAAARQARRARCATARRFRSSKAGSSASAQTRGTIYLNFDRNWRRGFSVSLRRDDSGLLGTYAGNPKGLEGRNVRVRGWIEQRGGAPVIDLSRRRSARNDGRRRQRAARAGRADAERSEKRC